MADNSTVTNVSGNVYVFSYPYTNLLAIGAHVVLPGAVTDIITNLGGASAINGVLTVVASNSNRPDLSYLASSALQITSQWTSAARFIAGHCATQRVILPSGDIAAFSGSLNKFFGSSTVKSEVYKWSDNTTTRIADFPGTPRGGLSAVLLQSGNVLLFGGALNPNGNNLTMFKDSWIYYPTTKTYRQTGDLPAYTNPIHCALLPNGKVFACGEAISATSASTFPLPASNKSFLFDETANDGFGAWAAAADMPHGVIIGANGMLPDGRFYVVGGRTQTASFADMDNHVQLYSYLSNTWESYDMPAIAGENDTNVGERGDPAVAILPNGNMLISGGMTLSAGAIENRASTLIFNTGTNTFSTTRGPELNSNNVPMNNKISGHCAITLKNGLVMLIGGLDQNGTAVAYCDYYDYATDIIVSAPNLPIARVIPQTGALATKFYGFETAAYRSALLLPNGNVFYYPIQLAGNAGGENKDSFVFVVATNGAQAPLVSIYDGPTHDANFAAIPVYL